MPADNRKPHVVILGAGPAGLGAAFALTKKKKTKVTVLELSESVGGYAGSFELSGVRVDYGSHRLHPACDPKILKDIQLLLGNDLLDRPRHGRIRIRDQWIHFPLKPLELALQLPVTFSLGVARDLIAKLCERNTSESEWESFGSVLQAGLGRTICRDFYFPYAHKIWGLPPDEISPTQAHRRVAAGTFGKIFRKIFSAWRTSNSGGGSRFFYPKGGFGQISEYLAGAAMRAGVVFNLETRITSIETAGNEINSIHCKKGSEYLSYQPDFVFSTIPVSDLVNCLDPAPPQSVVQAASNIHHRAMILIYLVLEHDSFSEYDAHYFPEQSVCITRLSEPKNYSNTGEPQGKTVLCAEMPCNPTDPVWEMTDNELAGLVLDCLESVDLAVTAEVSSVMTHKLQKAYPVYRRGFEEYFDRIDRWLSQLENLLYFGRQGLFVHDNTHHALYMGYSAAACVHENGSLDRAKWRESRRLFETHVVED